MSKVTACNFLCKNVVLSGRAVAHVGGQFSDGQGPIWLDELDCDGDENNLDECNILRRGFSDCRHEEDVGVSCFHRDDPDPLPDSGTNEGEVKCGKNMLGTCYVLYTVNQVISPPPR